MAYCRRCGTKLSDTAAFCKECGLKVGDEQEMFEMPIDNVYGMMPEHTGMENEFADQIKDRLSNGKDLVADKSKEAADKFKEWLPSAKEKTKAGFERLTNKVKNDKRYAIFPGICALLFVVGIISFVVLSRMSKKIDLEKCFMVSFYGYDSTGQAEVHLDENMLMREISDVTGEKKYEKIPIYELKSCINYKLDQDDGLSNGDTVKLEVICDNERAGQYKVKFTENVYSFEVNGLEELKHIDPFADLAVSFEGISPYMRLNYEYNGNDGYLDIGMFSADKYEGIGIGDVVTITLDYDENAAASGGYQIDQTVKEYECTQGAAYVESVVMIPEMELQTMIRDAKDCVKSFYESVSDYVGCTDLGYAGMYLLFPKNADTYYDNILYIVCSGEVFSRERDDQNEPYFETQQVFMPIGLKNIILQADGSFSYDMISSDIMGSTNMLYDDGWYNVPGYQQQDRMYNELLGGEMVNYSYTYEISGSLQDLEKSGDYEETGDLEESLENEDYVLYNSDSSYLSAEDIESLSDDELRIARNEIYARHGRIFQDEWLQNYFDGKSWYNGTTQEVAESELNSYEIANRDLIIEEENSRN